MSCLYLLSPRFVLPASCLALALPSQSSFCHSSGSGIMSCSCSTFSISFVPPASCHVLALPSQSLFCPSGVMPLLYLLNPRFVLPASCHALALHSQTSFCPSCIVSCSTFSILVLSLLHRVLLLLYLLSPRFVPLASCHALALLSQSSFCPSSGIMSCSCSTFSIYCPSCIMSCSCSTFSVLILSFLGHHVMLLLYLLNPRFVPPASCHGHALPSQSSFCPSSGVMSCSCSTFSILVLSLLHHVMLLLYLLSPHFVLPLALASCRALALPSQSSFCPSCIMSCSCLLNLVVILLYFSSSIILDIT